jgi:hypothetical protein
VTHEINADPEIWELREKFGDRAGFVWLECLAIADRNEGVVGPASDQTRNQLASKCRTSRVKVGLVLDWCRVKGWLLFDSDVRVAKFPKYHKTRESKSIPSYPNLPNLPNHPNLKRQQQPSADHPADAGKNDKVDAPRVLSDEKLKTRQNQKLEPRETPWGKIFARLYLSDQRRFAKLAGWIESKRRTDSYTDAEIASTLLAFEHNDKTGPPVDNWWPYLNVLIDKKTAKDNAREFESDHGRIKSEEAKWARANLLGL